MISTFLRRKSRLAVLVVGAAVVLALLWSAASAQPGQPPFLLYGDGETGDVVMVYDVDGEELGTAMVAEDGTWYVNVVCDSDEVKTISFSLNGAMVQAEIDQTGEDQANVILMPMGQPSDEDGVSMTITAGQTDQSDDGDLLSEDEALGTGAEISMYEDSAADMSGDLAADMAGDETGDTSMASGNQANQTNGGYPESGSGGLADGGPGSEALIGTIALLAMVGVIASLGAVKMRRSRNRA